MKTLTFQSRRRRRPDGRVHLAVGIIPGAKAVDDPVALGSMAPGLDATMSQPLVGYVFVGAPNLATLLRVVEAAHAAAVVAGGGEAPDVLVPQFAFEDLISVRLAIHYFDQFADLDGHASGSTGQAPWISSESLRYFILHAPSSSELMKWAKYLYKNVERLGAVVTTRSSSCAVAAGGAAMQISFGQQPVYGLTYERLDELSEHFIGVPAE
jgi:hypothetical protein